MLKELNIKNFAIIDDLTVPFGPGFNVLTGETGAGKSIIVQALGLILGDRAAADVVRSGEKEAVVCAVFLPSKDTSGLKDALKKISIEADREIFVKRIIGISGKSKILINEQTISLSQLKALSPFLLEISSQHEHQRLLNDDVHLEFVDRYGGHTLLKERYTAVFNNYNNLKNRLAELEKLAASKAEQHDFITFQINEIDSAKLIDEEDEDLEKERNVIKNVTSLFEKLNQSETLLYSSQSSVETSLVKIGELIASVSQIDPEINGWLALVDEAEAAVGELSRNVQNYLKKLDVDPARVDEIEERLYEIRRLKKKYGSSISEILARGVQLKENLKLLDTCEEEVEKSGKELNEVYKQLKKDAEKLSVARLRSAEKLSKCVQDELNTLGLVKTTFIPGHVKLNIDQADASGIDRFSFLISPNPGEPLKPLSRIASGGELSRIMLGIKNVLLEKTGLAELEVFDEIDVGIGGANAEIVGKKLKEMSKCRQLICITHLPQVACFAEHHVYVTKEPKGGRTVTRFKLLDDCKRIEEIARMLGGLKITKTTMEHAEEMLKRSAT